MPEAHENFRIRVIGTRHWLGPRWISEALQEVTIPGADSKIRKAICPAPWWVPEVRAKVLINLPQLKGFVTKAGVTSFPHLEIVYEDGTVEPLEDVMTGCFR